MTGSTDSEDIEIKFLREMHEIKIQLQEVKSILNNNQLQIKMAINDHQVRCLSDCDFVKKSELNKEIDNYFADKQKKVVNWVETIKSIVWLLAFIGGITYLKKG